MARYFAEKTPYYYEYEMEDEVYPCICYFTDKDEMFVEVAHRYAFDDCEPTRVTKIVCDYKEVHYDGWAPDMYFSFSDNEKTVWDGYFECWDH